MAWAGLFNNLMFFPMYAAVRFGLPLRDDLFARMDGHIGLQLPAVLAWMSHHPAFGALLSVSYVALIPMMLAALLATVLVRRLTPAKEFLVSIVIATGLTIPVIPFLSAVGPWVAYGIAPSPEQAQCAQLVLGLRQPGPFTIDLDSNTGPVAFPSFHVILAILSAVALCSIKRLRIPAILLCALIVISTVTTGWHYVVDVLGGVLFAALSVTGARLFTRMEGRWRSRPANQFSLGRWGPLASGGRP